MPFRALGLGDKIFKAVQEAGYTEPTPIQAAAIPQILAGHDLIGIAQTGTGKTAAFTLPMLAKLAGADRRRHGAQARARSSSRRPANSSCRSRKTCAPMRSICRCTIATVFGGVGERPQIEALARRRRPRHRHARAGCST